MNIHEFQAKQLFADYGIPTVKGVAARSADAFDDAVASIPSGTIVVKAQIHAGGRGKGTFTDGYKGGVKLVKSKAEAKEVAARMLGIGSGSIRRRILVPQMWTYALPGLANLWMILTKATPLLFVLGVEDIVYWARELGGAKTRAYAYPHPDWRLYYFLAILVFYLLMTWGSERIFDRIRARLSRGQATAAGEAMRKAAT